MKTSKQGLDFIKDQEGIVLHPYKDTAGNLSIGIGHKIRHGESFNTITQQQAYDILAVDLRVAESAVNSFVKVPLFQPEFDMLVDFTFNCGDAAFQTSTLLKLLNQKQYAAVPAELLKWDKEHRDGELVVNDDLKERRQREGAIWTNGYSK